MLAVLTTHPIQYQTPIWKLIASRGRVPFKVYYLSDHGHALRHDPGFGQSISWDIDLLSGYDNSFVGVKTSLDQSSFWWLRLVENIASRARAEGATTLWLQGWQTAAYWQAVWQARRQGLDLWLRAETNLRSTGGGRLSLPKSWAQSLYIQQFKKLLYIGEANKRFFLSRGAAPDRLAFAPYCIDNQRFKSQALMVRSERAALRARWAIPENAFCVVFVGKLISKKRPLDLVRAVASLGAKAQGRPVHILFVGSGELAGAARDACDVVYDAGAVPALQPKKPGSPTASFAGFLNQSEIVAAYVAADCLVLPSEATETWGLVVNEALACGLPVAVSDACGCGDDLVRPFRPDLCFPLGDISGIAASILSLMHAPPGRDELASLIEKYDILRTVETIEKLYTTRLQEAPSA